MMPCCVKCDVEGLPAGWPLHDSEQHIYSGDPDGDWSYAVLFDRPWPQPPPLPERGDQADTLEHFVEWAATLGLQAVGTVVRGEGGGG